MITLKTPIDGKNLLWSMNVFGPRERATEIMDQRMWSLFVLSLEPRDLLREQTKWTWKDKKW